MKKFNYAVVRTPTEYNDGLSEKLNYSITQIIKEHDTLVHFLRNVPIRVHSMPSVVNDVIGSKLSQLCIATPRCVVLTNFVDGLVNNQKINIATHLGRFYPLNKIHFIDFPGLVSTKDVLTVDDTYYISLSDETNQEGAAQLSEILSQYGLNVVVVKESVEPLSKYLNYIEGNNLLVREGYEAPNIFDQFNKVIVPEEEKSAIGAIWINEVLILPNDCPRVKEYLIGLDRYKILSISIDEMSKINNLLKEYLILF